MFKDIVRRNRSYRRFFEHESISRETLLALVDLARLVPSGANKQALKYYLSCTGELNEKIFRTLGWAGYLQDWPGPAAGERPAAYIVIVQDAGYPMTTVIDYGIAAQTILLGAVEMGFGGCLFGNIQKAQLRELLDVPADYEILLVIALGRPKETVVIDEIARDGDIKYWRDQKQIHHVPKRKLQDIIMN